jgi:hypothetical protein
MTVVLMFTGSASAATVVGNGCSAIDGVEGFTIVSLKNPLGSPLPNAIPGAGVITSWTYDLGIPIGPEVQVNAQLKVFAPTGLPNQFKVVGESALSPIGPGLTAIPTRVRVDSGDMLGSTTIASEGGKTGQISLFCETGNAQDEIVMLPGDPGTGITVATAANRTKAQNPVTVTVEPDADGDGYGDETQDQCPTDASTHGPCPVPQAAPAPPAPITLSASAAAKKTFLTVSLTTTAQASVTVSGTVKIAKGKSVKLSGNTQTVALGALAKFTVLFPAKLKAALKQLPTSKKLTINLSASAPGATTKNLTVKVPGQKRPRRAGDHEEHHLM